MSESEVRQVLSHYSDKLNIVSCLMLFRNGPEGSPYSFIAWTTEASGWQVPQVEL